MVIAAAVSVDVTYRAAAVSVDWTFIHDVVETELAVRSPVSDKCVNTSVGVVTLVDEIDAVLIADATESWFAVSVDVTESWFAVSVVTDNAAVVSVDVTESCVAVSVVTDNAAAVSVPDTATWLAVSELAVSVW